MIINVFCKFSDEFNVNRIQFPFFLFVSKFILVLPIQFAYAEAEQKYSQLFRLFHSLTSECLIFNALYFRQNFHSERQQKLIITIFTKLYSLYLYPSEFLLYLLKSHFSIFPTSTSITEKLKNENPNETPIYFFYFYKRLINVTMNINLNLRRR